MKPVQYIKHLVSTVDIYGLLPDGTKPLPEPMLTYDQWVLWHSPDNNFTQNTQDIYRWNEFEIY